jgi:SAM-dependent methyltransferase
VSLHRVRVAGVPAWVPASRLLGVGAWVSGPEGVHEATLDTPAAADLSARLRGLGMGGCTISVMCSPALPRAAVRAARLEDARRRRDTTPGFERPGTRLDAEGRMSLTPEALARTLAAELPAGGEVWDLGCGAGGNAIAFARAGHSVVAVERDAARLADARHNAGVYGVTGRIRFVQADAVAFLAASTVSAETTLFVDPPWGAEWDRVRCAAEAFPLLTAVYAARGPRALFAKLPPSFDPATLDASATATAYFGVAGGDAQRVKFVRVWVGPASRAAPSPTATAPRSGSDRRADDDRSPA